MFTQSKKTIFSILLGIILEWYSYSMYGFLASTLARTFFPQQNHLLSLTAIFTTYAVGFIAAPLGALIFGHLGDRHGRKFVLTKSITLMAFSTGLIAVLPDYQSIGNMAGILLSLFLMMQGFAVSGEDNASVTILIESCPPQYQIFVGSLMMAACTTGAILSSFVGLLITQPHIVSWAWRLAFAIGSILGFIGLYLRIKCLESPSFLKLEQERKIIRYPLKKLFTVGKFSLLKAVAVIALQATIVTLNVVFMNSYLMLSKHWTEHQAMYLTTASLITALIATPFIGLLAERLNLRKMLLTLCVISIGLAYPLYLGLQSSNLSITIISSLSLALLAAFYNAPTPTYLCRLFSTDIRLSGMAVSNNITWIIFGGFVPLAATLLIHSTGNIVSPCFLIILAAVLSLLALVWEDDGAEQK